MYNDMRCYCTFIYFQVINRKLVIKDEMGKPLPAIKVFSLAIRYIAENMVKSGSDKVTSAITRDDVHWVLTVPAIWSDAAKQFMRTAAIEVITRIAFKKLVPPVFSVI